MASTEQLNNIWYLSDSVLYPEAIAFLHRLVEEEECSTLPASQVMGLQNIANALSYKEIEQFIRHQRDRNWPQSKRDLKTFYTELEKLFTTMKNKRIREEFHLVPEGLSVREGQQEVDGLMVLLAREFIQHLIAENAVFALTLAMARRGKGR